MQKHVNLVDLVKSFPTNILLQNLASIQRRTSLIKFAHLAEKSEYGSISNLSIKVQGYPNRGADPERHDPGGRASRRLHRAGGTDLMVAKLVPLPASAVQLLARGGASELPAGDSCDAKVH